MSLLNSEYIGTTEARAIAESKGISISLTTLLKWVECYQLGHQLGGRSGKWVINRAKWEKYLTNDYK